MPIIEDYSQEWNWSTYLDNKTNVIYGETDQHVDPAQTKLHTDMSHSCDIETLPNRCNKVCIFKFWEEGWESSPAMPPDTCSFPNPSVTVRIQPLYSLPSLSLFSQSLPSSTLPASPFSLLPPGSSMIGDRLLAGFAEGLFFFLPLVFPLPGGAAWPMIEVAFSSFVLLLIPWQHQSFAFSLLALWLSQSNNCG